VQVLLTLAFAHHGTTQDVDPESWRTTSEDPKWDLKYLVVPGVIVLAFLCGCCIRLGYYYCQQRREAIVVPENEM